MMVGDVLQKLTDESVKDIKDFTVTKTIVIK